jgi:phenylalanyl-tRNA synthetase beta chain
MDEIWIAVPHSKPDITIPADIVEEIMRIDGLDNVEIPAAITTSPSVETLSHESSYKEKAADYLVGLGFNEIFTNSITNSAYFSEEVLATTVKMINSLSAELDVMRPSILPTGLESIAYNLNRKNNNLRFFEFGKTYAVTGAGKYSEQNHLGLFITGNKTAGNWQQKSEKSDFYYLKGVCEKLFSLLGIQVTKYQLSEDGSIEVKITNDTVARLTTVGNEVLAKFDIKQPVYFADLAWDKLLELNKKAVIRFEGIPKYPPVQRDLSIVVDKGLQYEQVEKATAAARVNKLCAVNLFDVFESDKLGAGKKSLAVSFTFLDEEKTLTDKEIDSMMSKIISSYEKELGAEIRK